MRPMLWPDVSQGQPHCHSTHLCAHFIKRTIWKRSFQKHIHHVAWAVWVRLMLLLLKFKQMDETWEFIFNIPLKKIIWFKLPNPFPSFHPLAEMSNVGQSIKPRVQRYICHSIGLCLLPEWGSLMGFAFAFLHWLKSRTNSCQTLEWLLKANLSLKNGT